MAACEVVRSLHEAGDGAGSVALEWLWRHGEPGIFGEHGDYLAEIAAFEGLDETFDRLRFGCGSR